MSDGVSSEPVIAPLPTPLAVEPRTAAPGEAAEVSRQTEEAKVADSKKDAPKAAEPVKVEPKKPISTREAVRAAAAKVNAEPTKEAATPIKAAEPAAKDAPKAADAKVAAEPVKDAPARAEDGKFVSTKAPEPVKAVAADGKVPDPTAPKTEPAARLPSHTAEAPPARFSAAAKEKWAEAPDEVRAEVTRAVTELTKGFEKHREAAARDADLADFHEMATKGGTTVKQALSNYVNMENVLRADPMKGFELICQNAGLSLRDLAAKVLNQTPEESASKADATVLELRNQNAALERRLAAIETERNQTKTDLVAESVTKFAADHPRFDELVSDIAEFLTPVVDKEGNILKPARTNDLAEAYSLAERLNPAPAAPAPKPAEPPVVASSAPLAIVPTPAPAHTERGQKSIEGAPSAGSNPAALKKPSSSIREALRRAASAAR